MAGDHFQILGFRPRAWLEESEVREQFQQRAGAAHPDTGGGSTADFAQLNAAYQVLRDPVARLRHFLQLRHANALEGPQSAPPDLADLFMEIAEVRQQTSSVATKLGTASAPLTRALLESERIAARRRVQAIAERLQSRAESIHQTLRSGREDPVLLSRLLNELAFVDKWLTELRELGFSLS